MMPGRKLLLCLALTAALAAWFGLDSSIRGHRPLFGESGRDSAHPASGANTFPAHTTPTRRTASDSSPPVSASSVLVESEYGGIRIKMISGRVDESPSPMDAVEVNLVRLAGGTVQACTPMERTTDAEGIVCWSNLVPGRYRADTAAMGCRFLTVEASQIVDVIWTVPSLVMLVGIVTSIEGVPVPGARIWLSQPRSKTDGQEIALTDENGLFQARASLENERWITAFAGGFEVAPLESVASKDAHDSGIIELHLSVSAGGEILRGRVIDEFGAPIEDASVYLFAQSMAYNAPGEEFHRARECPRIRAITSDSGAFELAGFPPTAVVLEVIADGYARTTVDASRGEWRTTEIILTLDAESRIAGRVVDSSGDPIAGVTVATGPLGRPGTSSAASDVDGQFELVGLRSGVCRVRAWCFGYESAEKTISVSSDELVTLADIELAACLGVRIKGTVTPSMSPLGDPWTIFANNDGKQLITQTRGGHFELSPVNWPAGTISVAYNGDPALSAYRTPLIMSDARDGTLELHIAVESGGGLVSGRLYVEGHEGNERLGVIFRCMGAKSIISSRARLGDGAFSTGLPGRGEWSMDVIAASGETLYSQFLGTIENGGRDLGIIQVGASGLLTFTANGAEGITVSIFRPSGALHRTVDIFGSMGISLRPGHYVVEYNGSWAVAMRRCVEVRSGQESVIDLHNVEPKSAAIHVEFSGSWSQESWATISAPGLLTQIAPLCRSRPLRLFCLPGQVRILCGSGMEIRHDQVLQFDGTNTQVVKVVGQN
jgi:hypothetical protein